MSSISINLSVHTEDQSKALKAAEVLARTAAGLVLDGIDVNMSMYQHNDEEDD